MRYRGRQFPNGNRARSVGEFRLDASQYLLALSSLRDVHDGSDVLGDLAGLSEHRIGEAVDMLDWAVEAADAIFVVEVAPQTNRLLQCLLDARPFVRMDHLQEQLIGDERESGIKTEDAEMFPRPKQRP